MRFFIIAGEASGDLYASHLVDNLRLLTPDAEFVGWGGNLMIKSGVNVQKHIKDLAFMGFVEVLKNLRTILKNFKLCKKHITEFKPDCIILIDYPGFNLRMAKWAKSQSYNVQYFISPNVWAWNHKRVYSIRDNIDKMYVILPFEQEFYRRYGVQVDYYGHPLTNIIDSYQLKGESEFKALNNIDDRPIIALLPGSRKQEIKKILPIMLQVSDYFKDYNFIIAAAPSIDYNFYNNIIGEYKSNVSIIYSQTYEILKYSYLGLVTSGTATLEAALFNLPQIVCYKAGFISYSIARLVAKVKYISLVNLILNKSSVVELIQKDLTISNLNFELNKLMSNQVELDKIYIDYKELKSNLLHSNIYAKLSNAILQNITKK